MRPISRLACALALAACVGACLDEKAPADSGGSSEPVPATSASSTNSDVESLRKSKADSGFKDYFVLSPEDSQTDDTSLPIKLVRIKLLRRDRIGIVLELDNGHDAPINSANFTASLIDANDRSLPLEAKPSETIAPDGKANLVWIFNAKDAAKGSFEMRLEVPETKTWPVVFSKEKPPDFKATPTPEGPQGPGGAPGGAGGPMGGGRH